MELRFTAHPITRQQIIEVLLHSVRLCEQCSLNTLYIIGIAHGYCHMSPIYWKDNGLGALNKAITKKTVTSAPTKSNQLQLKLERQILWKTITIMTKPHYNYTLGGVFGYSLLLVYFADTVTVIPSRTYNHVYTHAHAHSWLIILLKGNPLSFYRFT